ncbi:N-acetylmuramoyl-L-alanine amidase [Microcoleus phage My-WqHQDG]|nr:N-acetylmuramoyl-L-alanine amidase [Microcoleus phage My-WqHQDG]
MIPIVVLHDSNGPGDNALSWSLDNRIKGSYHSLIRRDGEVVYLIPAWVKASACGPSSYITDDGRVSINGSVDPFAYSICLEGPMPYTVEEYYSLSYLISLMGITREQVVVHDDVLDVVVVDRDPCTVDMDRLWKEVSKWEPKKEIYFGIGGQ